MRVKDALFGSLVWMVIIIHVTHGAITKSEMDEINSINKKGPYYGIVVPNSFEISPLLQSPSFVVNEDLPSLDFAGNCYHTIVGLPCRLSSFIILLCCLLIIFMHLLVSDYFFIFMGCI